MSKAAEKLTFSAGLVQTCELPLSRFPHAISQAITSRSNRPQCLSGGRYRLQISGERILSGWTNRRDFWTSKICLGESVSSVQIRST